MSDSALYAVENAWICTEPDSPSVRQMLFGDTFVVMERKGGWAQGMAMKDAYQGWVKEDQLCSYPHLQEDEFEFFYVGVRSSWGYEAPDIKSRPLIDLHMTSTLLVTEKPEGWLGFLLGNRMAYVPAAHCKSTQKHFDAPAEAARAFLGTPYVWAGNTGFGLDCSGLVQVCLRACGGHSFADSHQQETMTKGTALSEDEPLRSGDLLFWNGHVAMASGPNRMIHANAHHMAVVEEPLEPALARIAATDTGPVTSRLRPEVAKIS